MDLRCVGIPSIIRRDNLSFVKVLLAAGGFDHVEFEYLSSTELLTVGSDAWTMATPLPGVMYGMRTANVDNKVFLTG